MSSKAIRHFIRQLSSDDEAARADAADGLARYGPLALDGVPALAKALQDRSGCVRNRAATVTRGTA